MRLGGKARYLAEITNKNEVAEAMSWAEEHNSPVIMIGRGSNIIWGDQGFSGLVLINEIKGFEEFNEDEENLYVSAGSGEDWDTFVSKYTEKGYSGLERLSLIPGTVGASPVQNIGAYGAEVSNTIVSVEAYDKQKKTLVNIPSYDCNFSYRTSRFRTTDKGRFFITSVTYHLVKQNLTPPFYDSLQRYFEEKNITEYTPQAVREAVINIRNSKLPNTEEKPNSGSFFYNPIISQEQFNELLDKYPNIVYWHTKDGQVKIAAAWLIDQAGFRGIHDETGMGIWPDQALVFVNEHAASTADLLKFKQKVVGKVQEMFGITLEQEPELII